MLNKEQQIDFYKKLGERIRAARLKEKVKQEYLAQRLGFKTRVSIVNIEQGRQQVLVHTLVEISHLLKTEINELLPPITEVKLNARTERNIEKELMKIHDTTANAEIIEIIKNHINKKST